MQLTNFFPLVFVTILLGGCVEKTKPLYNWDGYQDNIYLYYKSDSSSAEQQIASLKENIEKSKAKGMPVPPGLHAHLGMLYGNTGRTDLAMVEFATEKSLFPESGAFIDFLTSKNKGAWK